MRRCLFPLHANSPFCCSPQSETNAEIEGRHDVRVEVKVLSARADGFAERGEVEQKVRCEREPLSYGIVDPDTDGDEE